MFFSGTPFLFLWHNGCWQLISGSSNFSKTSFYLQSQQQWIEFFSCCHSSGYLILLLPSTHKEPCEYTRTTQIIQNQQLTWTLAALASQETLLEKHFLEPQTRSTKPETLRWYPASFVWMRPPRELWEPVVPEGRKEGEVEVRGSGLDRVLLTWRGCVLEGD